MAKQWEIDRAEFKLEIDKLRLQGLSEEIITEVLQAGTDTVVKVTRRLEQEFEGLTRAAVPGKLWRAWKSQVEPRNHGPAYAPSGEVFVNGGTRSQRSMVYWTRAGINRAKNGFWLAIPLPAAGPNNRKRDMNPSEWEARTGIRLTYIPGRRGKNPYLAAVNATFSKNNKGHARKFTTARAAQGRQKTLIPIFVLIPFQKHANRISLEPAIRRAEASISSEFAKILRA